MSKGLRIYTNNNFQLFLNFKCLKFTDQVKFRTVQILYKANNYSLADMIKMASKNRGDEYNLRGKFIFKKNYFCTNLTSMCISVCTVTMEWFRWQKKEANLMVSSRKWSKTIFCQAVEKWKVFGLHAECDKVK